jgi:glucokinase
MGPAPVAHGHDVVLGVDVGGTKILGVALGADDRLLAEVRRPSPHALDADAAGVADHIVDVARELASGVAGNAACLGVGVPGMVDLAGSLRYAPNLTAAARGDLRSLIARRWGSDPLAVLNDANGAALAEHVLGAGRGADDVLVVTLGTGIGGGAISGGRLFAGGRGFAGEIGHMVVDPSGPQCACGRRGCWERFASGSGLGRLAREAAHAGRLERVLGSVGGDAERVRGEDVTAAARGGDPEAVAVLEELASWVALGLANLAAAFDPTRIVIGGGLAEAGELLLVPTRARFGELLEGADARPPIDLVVAQLGERAGAIGAALFASGMHGR